MRVLVVGGDGSELREACGMAGARGANVRRVATAAEAIASLRRGEGADLLLVDVGADVRRLIGLLKSERICAPSFVTAPREAAINAGASNSLPLSPDPALIAAIPEAVGDDCRELVFEDVRMVESLALARQIAPSDASVLVTGESGTGKEMVARYLHRHSRRAQGPFVPVNCAAIPENLLESELFGHEKGAFTGATARRIGRFEEATSGTLLLDEISEMDARLQAKLLRAIQEREIDRVGGSRPVKVDLRLIATSNRNLEAEVAAGRFREDLYFRLNVVTLHLPPLRDRPGDIAPLSRHFAAFYARLNGLPDRPLSAAALARLHRHGWKGNVRELENCLHRAVLLARGDEIDAEAISLPAQARSPEERRSGADGAAVGRTVAEVERDLIIDTLRHTFGNRTHAAAILGISIRTLRNKLRQYGDEGISVPPPPGALGEFAVVAH
jgi:two-component system response regulator FlrC